VVYTDEYFATACKRQKCVYFAILEFERQIQSHFVQSSSSLLHQKGFTYRFDSNLKAWWIGYMSGVLGLSVSYLSNVNICQVYDDLTEWIELSARNFPVLRDAAVESQFRRLAERLRKSHPSRTYFVTSYVEWGHSFLLNGTICLREGRTKEVPGILKKSLLLKELFWVLSLEELTYKYIIGCLLIRCGQIWCNKKNVGKQLSSLFCSRLVSVSSAFVRPSWMWKTNVELQNFLERVIRL